MRQNWKLTGRRVRGIKYLKLLEYNFLHRQAIMKGSGINNVSSRKGSVPMKKLRSEVRNCLEVRNRKIMKNYSSAKDKSTFKPSDIIVLDD